jgi:protein involved in polysaccharide export with SLBB domain
MKQKTVEKPGWRQPTHPEEIRNPKHEIRNNLKTQMTKTFLSVLNFGFRISDLKYPVLLMVLLCTTGWAQSNQQSTPSANAPTLITAPGYHLHQGDVIEVRFFYQPELNQEAVVRPDGTISLQLINDVRVEGLTVQELEQQLAKVYSKFLVDPVISVVLKEYVKPRIFVGGQVTKPGAYELRDGDFLTQALILAGGFTLAAHRKQVVHARPIREGEMRVTVVDATRLFSRNPDPALNLTLRDGDLIYVPESKLSRISDVLTALKLQTFGLVFDPFRRR